MNDSVDKFLRHALEIGALELLPGGRELKSGRISPYFFKSGLFYTGVSLRILAEVYSQRISNINYELQDDGEDEVHVVFGPAYKGIPLATTIVSHMGGSMEFSCDRKEVKDHGEGGIIMGAPLEGKNVIIVDDVMTTGSSIRKANDIISNNGGNVVACVVGFDRQEQGIDTDLSAVQAFEDDTGIRTESAVCLDDLINLREMKREGNSEILKLILEYRSKYGA